MRFEKDLVKAVSKGERLKEVEKLPAIAKMALGLAVQQLRESNSEKEQEEKSAK